MDRSLVLYFSSEVFLSTGFGILQYALPFYFIAHGATASMVGVLFALNALSGGFSALILGPMADRIGPAKVWKIATATQPIGYLLIAVTQQHMAWILGSMLTGLTGALVATTENVVLSALSQMQEKANIFSRFVAMYMFLMGIGNILSGWLSATFGFKLAVLIGALVSLVATSLRVWVKEPDAIAHMGFRMPSFRMLAVAGYAVLFGLGSAVVNPFATLVLHNHLGMSTHATSVVAGSALFMTSLGSLLVAFLIRRFRHNMTLLLSYSASVVFTIGLAFMNMPAVYSALYLARTASVAIPGPMVDAALLDLISPNRFSQGLGLRVFGNDLGVALGAYVGGSLLAHGALIQMGLVSAATFCMAAIYLLFLLRKTRY